MTIIQKIPGNVFSASLPKLYRDRAITAGCKFCFDAMDTYSWSKQAAPISSDQMVNLMDGLAAATFGATVPGWTNGFTFAAGADTINLPTSGKLATNAAGFLFVCWIKHGTPAGAGVQGVAGIGNNTTTDHQYSVSYDIGTTGKLQLNGNGNWPAGGYAFTPTVGNIYQLAIAAKQRVDLTYDIYYYVNGVLVSSYHDTKTSITATACTQPTVGIVGSAFSNSYVGTFYRAWLDDTSALASVADITALVLADYTANTGRFV